MAHIDPKLEDRIREAGTKGIVKAVVIVSKGQSQTNDVSIEQLIARVSKELQEQPSAVQYLPRLGAIVLSASGSFVRLLLSQKDVAAATIPDAEIVKGS